MALQAGNQGPVGCLHLIDVGTETFFSYLETVLKDSLDLCEGLFLHMCTHTHANLCTTAYRMEMREQFTGVRSLSYRIRARDCTWIIRIDRPAPFSPDPFSYYCSCLAIISSLSRVGMFCLHACLCITCVPHALAGQKRGCQGPQHWS